MASEREIFSCSGPLHLTAVDWNNPHHRRSVAASLVQGVYNLQHDRRQKYQGHQSLTPRWWEFFHFQLISELVDDTDHSIFGAVYEFKYPPSHGNYFVQNQNPPRHVVAFRGTIAKPDTWCQDLKLDLQFVRSRLQQSARFQRAMQTVQDIVAKSGPANVWLAGHSLGSAISLLAGKNMVKTGCFIETYLFNPPFPSAPIERIQNHNLKHGIRVASSFLTAGVAVAQSGFQQTPQIDDSFAALSGWIPYLFVHPRDPISAEYIGYFEHREKMAKNGLEEIGTIATKNSLWNLFSGASGSDSVPPHLLPSAYLTVNLNTEQDFKQSHGILQWLKPDIHCQFKLHQFK